MKKLSPNWITEGLIDFEYKKYMLLAYLQTISHYFNEQKLYPLFTDLIFHYQNLVSLRDSQQTATKQLSKKISRIDVENFRIEYEKMMNDNRYIDEVTNIVNYAIPRIEEQIKDGKEIYDTVEQNLVIEPVGILPLQTDIGYLLLINGNNSDTHVFHYKITLFESASEKYRAIRTSYLDSYLKTFSNTWEAIKLQLIKQYRDLPNPATFAVISQQSIPLEETFLPIAKRHLVRFVKVS